MPRRVAAADPRRGRRLELRGARASGGSRRVALPRAAIARRRRRGFDGVRRPHRFGAGGAARLRPARRRVAGVQRVSAGRVGLCVFRATVDGGIVQRLMVTHIGSANLDLET